MSKNFNICCPECFPKIYTNMEKTKQENKNTNVKLAIGSLLKIPALNKNLIIQNVLFVAQELIYITITNIIPDLNVTPKM